MYRDGTVHAINEHYSLLHAKVPRSALHTVHVAVTVKPAGNFKGNQLCHTVPLALPGRPWGSKFTKYGSVQLQSLCRPRRAPESS